MYYNSLLNKYSLGGSIILLFLRFYYIKLYNLIFCFTCLFIYIILNWGIVWFLIIRNLKFYKSYMNI